MTQYALGLRRLDVEQEQEKAAIATVGAVVQRTNEPNDVQARSRRVLLRLQHSANRSKWISSTGCALFVSTVCRLCLVVPEARGGISARFMWTLRAFAIRLLLTQIPVSYTHLTLPTILLV